MADANAGYFSTAGKASIFLMPYRYYPVIQVIEDRPELVPQDGSH